MKIVSVGGGPGGLYFALLMKKARPDTDITIVERNKPDDTFGWGVVFSKETLGNLEEADPETFAEIERNFVFWDDIETLYRGTSTRSTGHGFCGLSRKRLLNILQGRCAKLDIEMQFEREVTDLSEFKDADLILAADGVNSFIRERYADTFHPTIEWGRAKFAWLGTTLPLEAFTFIFEESEHGLFQVHAYPFEEGLSTFIVECHDDVWKRAGLDEASEDETVAYCERLFASHLDGHRLLTNRSVWRTFPTISCEMWHHDNIALLGDAVHTAHFSIGSGTKLAMEDAIALVEAVQDHPDAPMTEVLAAYQESRRQDVLRLQRAAYTSQRWFENSARYIQQEPVQFEFNLMSRSKRITWDNLSLRDPEFMDRVRQWYAHDVDAAPASDGQTPVPVFTPYQVRDCKLENRIVVSPMCQYSAVDGTPNDWHFVHLTSRAIGGAGLVLAEMTNVSADARITPGCAGLYTDEHVAAWKRIVDFAHANSHSKMGIQLGHAGRKGSTQLMWVAVDEPLEDGNWPLVSASPIPYFEHSQVPREMTRADMDRVRDDFVAATRRVEACGFDWLELHMAHGYLLASFISPLTNARTDEYGGGIENRMRYPLEVLDAVRATWPSHKPLSVRISATDWAEGGLSEEDLLELAPMLQAHGCDIIDVSGGGTVPWQEPRYGRMYQVPFSERIRLEAGIPTMTVGNLQGADHANTVIAAGRADLAVLARAHLRDPYIALQAAIQYRHVDHWVPPQYRVIAPRPLPDGAK